ncbi:MAG: hypothetical protein U0736_29090 [Gemmataceae bacterium]
MPKKTDHGKARSELAKLPPEALQAITVRLPAGLLIKVHRLAERKDFDLARAIRELIELGLEATARPGEPPAGDVRRAVKKWGKHVERALRAGRSPFEPLLGEDEPGPGLDALPAILTQLDYPALFEEVKGQREEKGPWIERRWKQIKDEAPAHLQPLMAGLDNLEKRFLARKKLYYREGSEGDYSILHWLLARDVMQQLKDVSDDADVEAARQLITARYLVPDSEERPWEFEWDE